MVLQEFLSYIIFADKTYIRLTENTFKTLVPTSAHI